MLFKFITKPHLIILAVTAATTDLANLDGLTVAQPGPQRKSAAGSLMEPPPQTLKASGTLSERKPIRGTANLQRKLLSQIRRLTRATKDGGLVSLATGLLDSVHFKQAINRLKANQKSSRESALRDSLHNG
ncbi:hypothetical protein PGT21_005651 [Puccinia graminis f. sp. tritici]|uniref:Uncharacterized protein n=1 Tax=Puccinia graminis f. sp. tritici TaxID=56615 RepID=A0A5B0MNA7_PUCGR|nr:hypothetical protein PGT21_005651 [Puccinia graminis f. sp. tritici]